MVLPSFAHAGFFSELFRFFTGGESAVEEEYSAGAVSLPLLGSGPQSPSQGVGGSVDEDSGSFFSATLNSALVAPKNPTGTLPQVSHGQIVVYTVQQGDTPGLIAEQFGISLNTLLWANNIRNPHLIKVGDELIILPVSGVKYEVKKGDTIESVAKKFKGDADEILSFNGIVAGESLEVGMTIIIPDGEFAAPITPAGGRAQLGSLPSYRGYYMRPVFGGRRSRGVHGFNGVDLADSCGLPVIASAGGTIIIARSSGWNGGYGKYIVITHPNGTQTLYAHLSAILGTVGQKVSQGSQIAAMGSTGNSTGCHVHFEVRGARNPF